MTLSDLVTEALAPGTQEEVTPTESLSVRDTTYSKTNAGEVLHRCKELLEEDDFQHSIAMIAALFFALGRNQHAGAYSLEDQARSPRLIAAELWALAADERAGLAKKEDIRVLVHQILDSHYLHNFFDDPAEQISYLQGFWGDETAERLARLGGVQKSTARNWMRGSNPSSATWQIRRAVHTLYHLRSSAGIEGDAAREWMDAPLRDGRSPFEIICARELPLRKTRDEVVLDPLTQELQRIGIRAFSWPSE